MFRISWIQAVALVGRKGILSRMAELHAPGLESGMPAIWALDPALDLSSKGCVVVESYLI